MSSTRVVKQTPLRRSLTLKDGKLCGIYLSKQKKHWVQRCWDWGFKYRMGGQFWPVSIASPLLPNSFSAFKTQLKQFLLFSEKPALFLILPTPAKDDDPSLVLSWHATSTCQPHLQYPSTEIPDLCHRALSSHESMSSLKGLSYLSLCLQSPA